MRIAVVGAGVSGLVCASLLDSAHEVVLFERDHRPGGHAATVDVEHEGSLHSVDTGFIVFNERNYPRFSELLRRLGVASRPSTMSFSVHDERDGFEYGGASITGLVGAWSNLLRPRWWRIVKGVRQLARRGKDLLRGAGDGATVGDLRASAGLSRGLLDDYLLPMAAAIWSAPREALLAFPARFVLRFLDNHGILDLRRRPTWRTVVGGSRRYVDAMRQSTRGTLRLGAAVHRIRRSPDGVHVAAGADDERFDEVIIAAHADQALAMLADASALERDILGAMPYQANETILHRDQRLLPSRRRCWAAWNYRLADDPRRAVSVTYNLSLLQGLGTRVPLCVTLNDAGAIDPSAVLARFTYHHPIYTLAGERARRRWGEISGVRRTHFCGAYWGNGFHEDGVVSALRVCESLGMRP